MSWTLALGAPDAALRELAGARPLVGVADAEVVLWPARRDRAFPASGLHVIDLRGLDPAEPVSLNGAGLLLVGSATAYGAWAVRAGRVPVGVVPPIAVATGAVSERLAALHLLVSSGQDAPAQRVADWAAVRGIDCGVAEGPLEAVARLGTAPAIAEGAVIVDLRAGWVEASPALLGLMAAGAPVLFGEDAPLRLAIEAAGAGWRFETVEAELDRVAELGAGFGRASAAAAAFVRARFGAAGAASSFERAVDGALARQRANEAAWTQLGPGGHVLVISDEGPNLRQIRVHRPFDELVRRGAIAGYSVLWRGEFVWSAPELTERTRFGAVWVQRSVDSSVRLLLRTLDRPFVYDLDDNLLVSPGYRLAFEAQGIETAAGLVRECAVLSCATAELAQLVPGAAEKAVVTPNLAFAARTRAVGPARTIVWASSDAPALTASRAEIERAVRDFAAAHGLPVLCLGAKAPAAFLRAGLAVEQAGLLPYADYLARLRAAAPGILVAPLETHGDPATQAFVDGKSDIKIIEAGLSGLVGVFSRATPYLRSELGPDVLCRNGYAGWTAGLAEAKALCERPGDAAAWPTRRDAAQTGPMPWAQALARAPVDLSLQAVRAALAFVHAQRQTLVEAPGLFDEADYLRRHTDVAAAVEAGVVASGYRHFVQSGLREGRAAQRVASAPAAAAFWWTRLLHELGTLEDGVAARERDIAALRERLATRRALPQTPIIPATAENDGLRWGSGERRALPCPICDATGPHPVAVQDGAAVLLRCEGCGSCFYCDRQVHEYAATDKAALLEQFSLEQNASIHHQTGLLFGREGARSVLDVGCGFGFAVDLASGLLGWRAVGVDPSWAAAAGRRLLGADLREAYLTAESDLGDRFDRVIASEVIEHVTEPYAFLALLRARVAPGGVLALTTPNAAAIEPGPDGTTMDRGRLLGIMAPGVHLQLFSERALRMALRRAGFSHVTVRAGADTLVAEASDWPLRASTAEAHGQAYRAYLERLLERAEPGLPLWSGAAGRLLPVLDSDAAREALWGRIAAAWQRRFGFDLAAGLLPAALDEAEIATVGAASLGRRQPFNLAGVLLERALMAERAERADEVERWAGLAYRVAVETRRVLQAENLVDLDLKRTAWRSRLLLLESLAARVPALAGTLLQAAGTTPPGDWAEAPDDAVIATVAPFFVAAVAADRFVEARRVERWVADADRVVDALAGDEGLLLRTLFMRGVLALVGDADPPRAAAAFERLGAEARRLRSRDYQAIAAEHLALARQRPV